MKKLITLAEEGRLPDALLHHGIRRLLAARRRAIIRGGAPAIADRLYEHIRAMKDSPIAMATDDANRQHYEVPTEFFKLMLGPRMKYSACLFEEPDTPLPEAEDAMLALTCQRAGLADGMDILELGCGWGALTLWMAEQFPASRITAVSNSAGQRAYIEEQARQRNLESVRVITADMNDFDAPGTYDRIVSLEMFEHMRNWQALKICSNIYGAEEVRRWFIRWRIFLLACADLFGYHGGEEWYVGHYLLAKS
jgi:cyclopropane-fatty-acyl-phospholipid synthase